MEEFYTIERDAKHEYIEKKSKFLAHVFITKTENEALEYLKKIRKDYWDASHNVYAYRIKEKNIQRFSDDGEPSGTAGKPILEIILKKDIQDVLIVVTRYFGGVKLGASGLLRAYGKSASLGIEVAGIIKKELSIILKIKIDYKLSGRVEEYINLNQIKIKNKEYQENVIIEMYVVKNSMYKIIEELVELTNAKISIEKGIETFI